MKAFIGKLRGLPESKRKVIFYAVLAVFGLAMLPFGMWSVKSNFAKLDSFSLDLPANIVPEGLPAMLPASPPEPVAQEPPKDETAGWKTHASAEYGFELKHPEDWLIVSLAPEDFYISSQPIENGLAGMDAKALHVIIIPAESGSEPMGGQNDTVLLDNGYAYHLIAGSDGNEVFGKIISSVKFIH